MCIEVIGAAKGGLPGLSPPKGLKNIFFSFIIICKPMFMVGKYESLFCVINLF